MIRQKNVNMMHKKPTMTVKAISIPPKVSQSLSLPHSTAAKATRTTVQPEAKAV